MSKCISKESDIHLLSSLQKLVTRDIIFSLEYFSLLHGTHLRITVPNLKIEAGEGDEMVTKLRKREKEKMNEKECPEKKDKEKSKSGPRCHPACVGSERQNCMRSRAYRLACLKASGLP